MVAQAKQRLMPVQEAVSDIISYRTLDSAENALFDALDSEEQAKLTQIVALIAIKRNQLYRDRIDTDTGDPFRSFEAYLKSIEPDLERRGVGKITSIKHWITNYQVYCEQLGYSSEWLLGVGSHAREMLQAANLSKFGSELGYENNVTDEGGEKLGNVDFKKFVDNIASRVFENDPNVPELQWTVGMTRDRVREQIGKAESPTWEWVGEVVESGTKVQVGCLTVFVEGNAYHARFAELIPIKHFDKIAKGKREIVNWPKAVE